MESGPKNSLADSFMEAVSAKILEVCQVVESEHFRASQQWLVSIRTFTHMLETYSLDWASSRANQQQLKSLNDRIEGCSFGVGKERKGATLSARLIDTLGPGRAKARGLL